MQTATLIYNGFTDENQSQKSANRKMQNLPPIKDLRTYINEGLIESWEMAEAIAREEFKKAFPKIAANPDGDLSLLQLFQTCRWLGMNDPMFSVWWVVGRFDMKHLYQSEARDPFIVRKLVDVLGGILLTPGSRIIVNDIDSTDQFEINFTFGTGGDVTELNYRYDLDEPAKDLAIEILTHVVDLQIREINKDHDNPLFYLIDHFKNRDLSFTIENSSKFKLSYKSPKWSSLPDLNITSCPAFRRETQNESKDLALRVAYDIVRLFCEKMFGTINDTV